MIDLEIIVTGVGSGGWEECMWVDGKKYRGEVKGGVFFF